jgi:hypothetical protein
MANERVTLPNGDWADLVTRVNHAQHRRIRTGYSSPELDTMTETVAAMVTNWSVHDVDGGEIPYPGGERRGRPVGGARPVPGRRRHRDLQPGRRDLPRWAGPKRFSRDIRRLSAGASFKVPAALADAYFLVDHPGWTWRDLEEAPEDLVDTMREIRNARIAQARTDEKRRAAEAQRPRRR